jgi:cytochrome c oxidase cbb3-type subunit 3
MRASLAHALVAVLIVAAAACRRAPDVVLAKASPPLPPDKLTVGPIPGGKQPSSPANPLEKDREAIQRGRRLFVWYNCAGCHGGHAGGGMGPSLRDKDWIYGSDAGRIFASIADGRAHGMPSWGTRLPTEEVWQLTAYIQSLGTSNEAEPPE